MRSHILPVFRAYISGLQLNWATTYLNLQFKEAIDRSRSDKDTQMTSTHIWFITSLLQPLTGRTVIELPLQGINFLSFIQWSEGVKRHVYGQLRHSATRWDLRSNHNSFQTRIMQRQSDLSDTSVRRDVHMSIRKPVETWLVCPVIPMTRVYTGVVKLC